MFWRKVDPNERQEVVDLLIKLSLASKEIDRAVDRMKVQMMAPPEKVVAPNLFMATVTDALETVERVRANTTERGFWPNLKDETGAKRMAEMWLRREKVFKHQLWRLQLYGELVASYGEGRLDENLGRESNEATKVYERALKNMNNATINLGKRYKVSILEYMQL